MRDYPEAADGAEALPLDPFGAYPSLASRIVGLGGAEPSPDPSYVFATVDSRPAIGRVRATVRFHDLAITHGTMLFEVRVRSAVPGAEPSRLKTIVVDAAELVAADGVVELDFESYRNAYYAIACGINDETDIAASAVSILLDRRATPAEHGREWEWSAQGSVAARRRSGIEAALVSRSLTDLTTPRLEMPQSQVGSPLQCREPAFIEAMQALRRPPAGSFENWSLAYVLRAIDRFSATGARRMLGYGDDQAPLLSYFAGRGCEVVGMHHPTDRETPLDPGEALERLWVPELCDEADFFAHAHFTVGDIRQPFETFRDQFDVLWSIGANRLMTPQEFVYFVVNGLAHAKPGGLAVHVFDYVEDVEAERGVSLIRHDIERIAALALSHANEVARLQFLHGAPAPGKATPLPFGLVLLRGGAQG
jgi:hypothetical protein